MSKYKLALTPILCFIHFGCVETLISVNVLPDARYKMSIISKGDKQDIEDSDFSIPKSAQWSHTTYQEEDSETGDIIYFARSEALLEGTNLLVNDHQLGTLRYPVSVKMKKGFFSDTYMLHQLFEGRGIDKKYPSLSDALLDPSDESKQLTVFKEVMLFCLSESFNHISTEYEVEGLLKERIVNHFKGVFYKAREDGNLKDLARPPKSNSGEVIDLPVDFIRSNFKPFENILPPDFIEASFIKMLPCINEANSTINLNDDSFKLMSTLPGRIFMSNSDSVYNDTLMWSFDLKDFANDSYIIEAASIIYYPKKIQKAVLVSTILILFVLFLIAKRKAIL